VAFVVLFSSFGSVRQSFLVLINVPTTLAGAILGLLVVGETVNVSSMIAWWRSSGSVPVLYEAMAAVFDRPGRPPTTARLHQSS
jgi:Cu/Ag efflux pump CusA